MGIKIISYTVIYSVITFSTGWLVTGSILGGLVGILAKPIANTLMHKRQQQKWKNHVLRDCQGCL